MSNIKKINTLSDIFYMFDDIFPVMTDKTSHLPYNIEKHSDNDIRLVFAVAGFGKDDITVKVDRDTLIIEGSLVKNDIEQVDRGVTFIHKGISTRKIEHRERIFNFNVEKTTLENGLLTIYLTQTVSNDVKIIPID